MQKIKFSKMHGLGNDFIVINATDEDISLSKSKIEKLSNRRTGIGFDQLLIVEKSEVAGIDFNYRIFNANGNEVEHCGNGARCFAKYVIAKRLTNKNNIRVKIKTGVITINYKSDDEISVNMGKPIRTLDLIPFKPDEKEVSEKHIYKIKLKNETIDASVISMSNPHITIFTKELEGKNIEEQALEIQNSKYFPSSVNVNYVEILNTREINLRTYERDVGETLACGTGACASVYLAHKKGLVDDTVRVKTQGGEMNIAIIDGAVYMSGPARLVFDGEIR